MDRLVIKYPLEKLMIFVVGAILGLAATALTAYDIWTDGEKLSWHFSISVIVAVTNLGMGISETRKYIRPVILDKEGILYGKERYFWSSLASCRLEREEENKLVLTFKETYAKPVSIDLNNYNYEKWNLVKALQHFPPAPVFKYEDE